MKKIMMLLLMCLTVFAGGASAFMVVNVDVGNNGGTYVGQGAFVDPGKDFWNGFATSGTNLKASDGVTATGVSVSTTSQGGFNVAAVTNKLIKDYRYVNGSNIGTITISGLEPNADYLIYAYAYSQTTTNQSTFTFNGVSAPQLIGTADQNIFVEGSNYVKIATRSNSTGTIAGTFRRLPSGSSPFSGLQIVLDARGAAHTPTPANGSSLVDPVTLTQLSWRSPEEDKLGNVANDPNIVSVDGYDIAYYVVNTADVTADDPNMAKAATYTNVSTPYTLVEPVGYDKTMFWRVDTHVTWDSNDVTGRVNDVIKGRIWRYTTKSFYMPPVLKFDNVTTAMPLLPAVLTAQVTQNTKPITSVVFEVLDGAPATVTRTDSDPANQNLTAELTTAAAGTYFVKLTISDGTTTLQDIAAVRVYETVCEAAKHVSGYTANYYDTNSDCAVNMLDFADLARQWLNNTAMTSPEPLQIAFGYIPVDILVESENAYRPQDPNFTAGAPLTIYADGDPRINNSGDIFGSSGGAYIWFADEGDFLSYQFEIPAVGGYTMYFVAGANGTNRTLEFEQVDSTTGAFIKDLFVVPVAAGTAVQSATVNFPDAGIITVRVTPHTPSGGFINQDFFAFKKL